MPSPMPSLAPVTTARLPDRSGTVMSMGCRGMGFTPGRGRCLHDRRDGRRHPGPPDPVDRANGGSTIRGYAGCAAGRNDAGPTEGGRVVIDRSRPGSVPAPPTGVAAARGRRPAARAGAEGPTGCAARRWRCSATCRPTTTPASSGNADPQPSEQMIASIAQGLHLSLDERDHLFRLAGHHPPSRGATSEHISPGLLRIFDRLQRHPGGDRHRARRDAASDARSASHSPVTRPGTPGPARSLGYRWFTDPDTRRALRAGGSRVPVPDVRLRPARGRYAARSGLKGRPLRRPAPGPERGVPHACGRTTRSASARPT